MTQQSSREDLPHFTKGRHDRPSIEDLPYFIDPDQKREWPEPEPKFRGTWVPAEVHELLFRGLINHQEFAILTIIDAHVDSRGDGCWASNEYLAKRMHRDKRSVRRMIVHLTEMGLLVQLGWKITAHGRVRVLETKWSRVAIPEDRIRPRKKGRVGTKMSGSGGDKNVPTIGVSGDPQQILSESKEYYRGPHEGGHREKAFSKDSSGGMSGRGKTTSSSKPPHQDDTPSKTSGSAGNSEKGKTAVGGKRPKHHQDNPPSPREGTAPRPPERKEKILPGRPPTKSTHVKLAEHLYRGLIKGRKLMRNGVNLANWGQSFLRLIREVEGGAKAVEEVLDWYLDHLGEEFVPEAYSADAFRKKFDQIHAAIDREDRVPQSRYREPPRNPYTW